uniref:CSON007712 protein n=1 Tax=Culicoides sonorensis TaxID=179676 RepID=A0A336M3A3_CULSO
MILHKILTILVLPYMVTSKSDWCAIEKDVNLCNGTSHTGCSGTGIQPPNPSECKNNLMVKMTPKLKEKILYEHNLWRNKLAGGKIKHYPTAAKMLKMHWDDELAYLAEKHVKMCSKKHDLCIITDKYRYPGQNIAFSKLEHPLDNYEEIVADLIEKWFSEHEKISESVVKVIVSHYQHSFFYGHFAIIARGTNDAVGCGMMQFTNAFQYPTEPYHYLLTCNYAQTNIKDEALYDAGATCSRCDAFGSDYECDTRNFKYLCDRVFKNKNKKNNEIVVFAAGPSNFHVLKINLMVFISIGVALMLSSL